MMILITIKMVCWTVYHYDFDYCLKNVCLHDIIFWLAFGVEFFRVVERTHSQGETRTKNDADDRIDDAIMKNKKNKKKFTCDFGFIYSCRIHVYYFAVDIYFLGRLLRKIEKDCGLQNSSQTFKCFIYKQAVFHS